MEFNMNYNLLLLAPTPVVPEKRIQEALGTARSLEVLWIIASLRGLAIEGSGQTGLHS